MPRWMILILCCCLAGCASSQSTLSNIKDRKEAEDALESVAEAISGKDLSEEELKQLKEQIRKDPEARSAVEVITNSVSGRQRFKYSPATGKRYAPHMEVDPETGVKLEWVE